MTALFVILGIIAFFILLLSIRITVTGEYFDSFKLDVAWLFIKLHIFPKDKKNKPKKAKKKEEPAQTEEKTDEQSPETEKKENIFVRFYHNQGVDGIIELINGAAYSLARMMNSFKKHIVLREIYLWMTVSSGDAAETALQYGKICQKVFPALSFICSTLTVKKYDVEIEPDFIGLKNSAQMAFTVSVRPIFIINAAIVLVFRLLFKVVLKFLIGIRNKKTSKQIKNEGGAL
ncbi:MAG: DUF2953 domain-containing protein [Oscillospiraceae bacterium]|nr:DUF2953 domain-containing protein [Oscillospiraceae bacterium]